MHPNPAVKKGEIKTNGRDWDILKVNSKSKSVNRDTKSQVREYPKTETLPTPISRSPIKGPPLNCKNLDTLNQINRGVLTKENSEITV